MTRSCWLWLMAGMSVVVAAPAAAQAVQDPDAAAPFSAVEFAEPQPTIDRGEVLSTLRPIVRRFDFDAPETGSNALPPQFYRYIAPSQGFPPFGEMRVVYREGAGSGALEFELQGGSMSARIGTSVVPVLPYADYVVACRVKTQGLSLARARLVAWLCDAAGREIPGSRCESRAVAPTTWEPLALELPGRFENAADLVLELQVVQPQHQTNVARLESAPQMQDVRGRAWFDDVIVSHLPRIALEMPRGALVGCGERAEFLVHVNELVSADLRARLRILDLDGQSVFDDSFAAPRGRQATTISAPIAACGWYRAVLEISGRQSITRRRWQDFVVLPADEESRGPSGAGNAFGIFTHPSAALVEDRQWLAMFDAAGAGVAVVPAWQQDTTVANVARQTAARRVFVDALLRLGATVHFSIDGVPVELARAVGPHGRSALEIFAAGDRRWQPYLDEVMLHYGLSAAGWHVGEHADVSMGELHQLPARLAQAKRALSGSAPELRMHVNWPIEQLEIDPQTPAAVTLGIGEEVQPAAIVGFLEPWLAVPSRQAAVALKLLPSGACTPRQRVIDSMLRGLHAWRAGASTILIQQPWTNAAGALPAQPDPTFVAWRTLAERLAGRTFVSELPLGPGIHAWVARRLEGGDASLIAWCDRDASAGPLSLDIQLASGSVRISDAFGNRRTLQPNERMHRLELSETPVFVEGISLELVMFRSGIQLDPAFVPAASRVHERHISLRNPWDLPIAGSIRLAGDSDLALSPGAMEFSIPPGGEVRLPLTIVPQRGVLAGSKIVHADIIVNADRTHALHVSLPIEVGLRDIELNVTWTSVFNPASGVHDLMLSPAVTNHSPRSVTLDIDLLAEGVSQMRRTIAALPPGQTQTRSFRVPNGMATLAGRPIRLGVAERDGVARLNRIITIRGNVEDAFVGADAAQP